MALATLQEQPFRTDLKALGIGHMAYLRPHLHKMRVACSLAMATLVGCAPLAPPPTSLVPQSRPPQLARPAPPSVASAELAQFYRGLEQDLLTRGLLRRDGGGPDTPYSDEDLLRNFETIAFFDEHFRQGLGSSGALSRWQDPVRFEPVFGPSISAEQQKTDRAALTRYTQRLNRVTGHPMSNVTQDGNFKVIYAGLDDRRFVQKQITSHLPGIDTVQLSSLLDAPRLYYCIVIAGGPSEAPFAYTNAVALIRSEHPARTREACLHEEVAQGLGLRNDSPKARPSIFNDDDEFARLTSHDETLLRILYDSRLTPGMNPEAARPLLLDILNEMKP
ncbi:DUF2927 domain-containing protein [Epibacterium ulvae]|uniref:DUF2927 domain-containing protein n=1 Tax=Epibacterium ulvae TaxID=1156985 RepID=UPI0031EA7EED